MISYIQFKDNYIDGGEDYVTFSACTVNIGNAMCPKVSEYFMKLDMITFLLKFAYSNFSNVYVF